MIQVFIFFIFISNFIVFSISATPDI